MNFALQFARSPNLMISCDKEDKFSPFLRVFSTRPNSIAMTGKKIYFPQSPCPSPTPVFQQLYMTLNQIERLTQSTDDGITSTVFNLKMSNQRRNSMSSTVVNNDINERTNLRRKSYPLSLLSSAHGRGTKFFSCVLNSILPSLVC